MLQYEIRERIPAGSAICTDTLKRYEGLDEFQHELTDHAVQYVRGEVHTNGLEILLVVEAGVERHLRSD